MFTFCSFTKMFYFQNIHLVAKWLGTLDKKVELYSTGSHNDYRVYMSAEPAPTPDSHIIPQGLLENAIKITNEPPTGMHANLHKALDLFDQVNTNQQWCFTIIIVIFCLLYCFK